MTSKELELKIEEYKAEVKEKGFERPLTDEEVIEIRDSFENMPLEYRDAIYLSFQNEHGNFEKLPLLIRNYLGAIALKQFRDKFGDNPSLENEEVRQYLDKNLMNAALRAGISAEKNQESTRNAAMALDTYMNAGLMKKTMSVPNEQTKKTLLNYFDENEVNVMVEKTIENQLVMAKMMLLAQLGKYDVIDKNGLSHELDVPVYETIVHGNRTNFVLPAGENSFRVIDSFMGQNGGANAGIEKRTAATHSVKLRKINENGALRLDNKELRTYNPFRIFGNQYGMNIAVGGLGEKGPDRRIITGNGESGHMYMRAESGDKKHCGSLLIGIESSAPGKSNYIGHSHSIRAKKAKQSAFLADKNIVGKKVGGRQVDLSGISAEALTNILDKFSEKYRELQRNPEKHDKLTELNNMLMGKQMTTERIMEMFTSLNIVGKNLNEIVSQARGGYISKIDVKNLSRDEFTQSIRAGFSQEKACNLAEARFIYSGDNLSLATGAIKELIFTHATRSLGWKIRHPIKNYRENKTITNLIKRLETDKKFERADIASAFSYYENTFSMNWGKELSYDRDAVHFESWNKIYFKESDDKLLNLSKSYYLDLSKGITAFPEKEVAIMQEELRRIQNNQPLDFDKESIVIEEENEMNKNVDISEEIISNPPETTKEKNL